MIWTRSATALQTQPYKKRAFHPACRCIAIQLLSRSSIYTAQQNPSLKATLTLKNVVKEWCSLIRGTFTRQRKYQKEGFRKQWSYKEGWSLIKVGRWSGIFTPCAHNEIRSHDSHWKLTRRVNYPAEAEKGTRKKSFCPVPMVHLPRWVKGRSGCFCLALGTGESCLSGESHETQQSAAIRAGKRRQLTFAHCRSCVTCGRCWAFTDSTV